MKYLIVVAHPDDEVLGAGASMWKWKKLGDVVDICNVYGGESSSIPSGR